MGEDEFGSIRQGQAAIRYCFTAEGGREDKEEAWKRGRLRQTAERGNGEQAAICYILPTPVLPWPRAKSGGCRLSEDSEELRR